MARPLIPFVQNGYYASRNWIPLVKGNGFTTSGGGEQEEVWETASGSIVTFDAVAAPLRQLSVAVEPVQSGTGDPSPTNVRPITGFDSVKVNRTGKNLLTAQPVYTAYDSTECLDLGRDFTFDSITISFTATNASYTVNGNAFIRFTTNDGTNAYQIPTVFTNGSGTAFTVNTQANGRYKATFHNITFKTVKFIYTSAAYSRFTSDSLSDFQLELGSTATAYEPYNGNEYTIQLGETVYGGTLDVVNGKMTVDRAMVDLGTLAWQYNTTWAPVPRFYTTTLRGEVIHYPGGQYPDGTLCSSYIVSKNTTVSTVGNDKTIGIGGDGYIYIQDESYDGTTLNDFKAALYGVQFVYMLATPFELTLTPEQISTLQGTNNVWSDAGDVTVEYRAQ